MRFGERPPARVTLAVHGTGGAFAVALSDEAGNDGHGTFTLDWSLPYSRTVKQTWRQFLAEYTLAEPGSDHLAQFGAALFQALIHNSGLTATWAAIVAASSRRPLHLTVELGDRAEQFARLPLELLYDEGSFIFGRHDAVLRRTVKQTPATVFSLAEKPRILVAWACPAGAGDSFDGTGTYDLLGRMSGYEVEHLPAVTQKALQERLSRGGIDILHLIAHGYDDAATTGVALAGDDGPLDFVLADRLAAAIDGSDVALMFLCSCKSAKAPAGLFSGVGQRVLAANAAKLAHVVAMQANLPVARSAELAKNFYERLRDFRDPAHALSRARSVTYQPHGDLAWSVPVLLSRPAPAAAVPVAAGAAASLPGRRAVYLPRPDAEAKILNNLRQSRLAAVSGLPGIGKTELAQEVARQALRDGLVDKVVYQDVTAGIDYSLLQTRIALQLGHVEAPKTDDEFVALLGQDPRQLLILLDNAEDLMLTDAAQRRFRDWLRLVLQHTERPRVLLSTHWAVGARDLGERDYEVPPMTEPETARLLEDELRAAGVFDDTWPASPAWRDLLTLIDGHPRTLALLAGQVDGRPGSLARVVERTRSKQLDAIVAADLLGRKDIYETLRDDQKARLRSLAHSLDSSFDVLAERHPAAGELFLALSLFPHGLPESVAYALTDDGVALDHVLRYHVAAWQNGRVALPVPIQWYADCRRRDRLAFDAAPYWDRAERALREYLEAADSMVIRGDISEGIQRMLREGPTLLDLARRSKRTPTSTVSHLGRMATLAYLAIYYAGRLDAAQRLLILGLADARTRSDGFAEANCLRSLGDLAQRTGGMAERTGDLGGAAEHYAAALALYREINERLGEANCLRSLGDVALRTDDLDGAKGHYAAALALYREINERLGEANCRMGLGLIEMARQNPWCAFPHFLAARQIARDLPLIPDRFGEQGALAYLAQAAAAAGDDTRALLLAEESLNIGREIYGQGQALNLRTQLECWQRLGNFLGMLATQAVLAILDRDGAESLEQIFVHPDVSQEAKRLLQADPEAVRQAAIAEVREQFTGDLFALPGAPAATAAQDDWLTSPTDPPPVP